MVKKVKSVSQMVHGQGVSQSSDQNDNAQANQEDSNYQGGRRNSNANASQTDRSADQGDTNQDGEQRDQNVQSDDQQNKNQSETKGSDRLFEKSDKDNIFSQGNNVEANNRATSSGTSSGSSSDSSDNIEGDDNSSDSRNIRIKQSKGINQSPISMRQTMNLQYRVENDLRNVVLDLSDSLESLDIVFKQSVIDRISTINPMVGNNLTKAYLNTNDINMQHAQISIDAMNFNAMQLAMMCDILGPLYQSGGSRFDQHMTHDELLSVVLSNQGNEMERQMFMHECINCLTVVVGQNMQSQGLGVTALINLKTDFVRSMSFLESDDTANARKSLIYRGLVRINNMKNGNTQVCGSGMQKRCDKKVGGLKKPEIDFEHSEKKLNVVIQFGKKINANNIGLDISKNGQVLFVWNKDKEMEEIKRKYKLPCAVEPGNVDAKIENGVLHLTCTKSSHNVKLS